MNTRPRTGRSRLLATLIGALLVGVLTIEAASAQTVRSETIQTPVTGRVHRVVVRNEVGFVHVVAGRPSSVRADLNYNYAAPTVTQSLRNGVLTVVGDCPEDPGLGPLQLGGFNGCTVDLTITVPRDVTSAVDAGLGDVEVRGLRGDQRLRTGLGDVTVDRVQAAAIDAASGLGDVTLSGVRANVVTATSDQGAVSVRLIRAASRLTARAHSGDVTVRVPSGRYALTAATELGDVVVRGIVRDRTAVRRITARTSLGDVQVTGFAP